MQLPCVAAFGCLRAKLQQMKVVVCCLDGENMAVKILFSRRIATNWKHTMKRQHFRCTEFDCLVSAA